MTLRVIFFDWGGTLAAPSPMFRDPALVWVHVAHELGLAELVEAEVRAKMEAIDPPWQQRMYGYLGRTDEFWHEYNLAVMDALDLRERREELDRRVSATFEAPDAYRLFPEVREVLAGLRTRGLRLGVISNHSERLLRVVRRLNLDGDLDPVVITQQVGAEKPDRRVFEFALERADCEAGEAVHVGDTFEADYLGATRAGLRGVWLNRKGSPPPAPCEVVTDLREFAARL